MWCVCLCACVQAPVDPSISLRQTILRGRLHTILFPGHAFAILAGPLGFLVTMRRSKQAGRVRQTLQHAAAESPSASFPSLSLSSIFPCCQLLSPFCICPVIPRTLHIVFFLLRDSNIDPWLVCLSVFPADVASKSHPVLHDIILKRKGKRKKQRGTNHCVLRRKSNK
jgi:hypothetical protein